MDIILIRHAHAEDRHLGLADEAREITEKGKQQIAEAVRVLRQHLIEDRETYVFSSDTARTLQTIKPILSQLELSVSITLDQGIYTGEFDGLIKELAALPDKARAFVCGHEPGISDLCELFSGSYTAFKKGGMVGLTRTGLSPLRAAVRWQHRTRGV